MTEAIRWQLSELKNVVECARNGGADSTILLNTLEQIVRLFETEENQNFILGKVIIKNDELDTDEDEASDD